MLFTHFFPKAKCHNRKKSIMKTPLKLLITGLTLLALSTLNPQFSTAYAQGSLTPPGAPAAAMKSLDQVYARLDSRTAITNAASTYIITVPGSYYLTTNLTVSSGNAITIATNGVTLDLNGFTLSSTAASAANNGIFLNSGLRNISILNGFIQSGVTNNGSGVYSGSGFENGIYWSGATAPVNTRVCGVSVAGVLTSGIYLDTINASVVEDCTVTTAGGVGIQASIIKGSVATGCGSHAIYGEQIADCRGISGAGYGVSADGNALNCFGQSSSAYGLYAKTAQNCYGFSSSSSGYGLYAVATAQNCYGYNSSSGTGLSSPVAIGCDGYSASGVGLSATIANSCWIGHGTTNITYKYNMP
jgi:hypothetical protein